MDLQYLQDRNSIVKRTTHTRYHVTAEIRLFLATMLVSVSGAIWYYVHAVGTADAGDGINHFLISQSAWNHPKLYLDLWGKPLFTLLSSPFAQFGMGGMLAYQMLMAMLTCLFSYSIASRAGISRAWLLPVIILFTPVFFHTINSGLTEITYAALMMAGIWLYQTKSYSSGSFIISLLPFVRPEAYILLPLCVVYLVIQRKYRQLPILLSGTLIFALIYGLVYHKTAPIIPTNYNFMQDDYLGQKGSLLHYFRKYREIIGFTQAFVFITGMLWLFIQYFNNKLTSIVSNDRWLWRILIAGNCLGILILHILLNWYPGIFNNLGMLRYFCTLVPLFALLLLPAINALCDAIRWKTSILRNALLVFVVAGILWDNYKQWSLPYRKFPEEVLMDATSRYIQSTPYLTHHLVFQHIYLAYILGLDAYNDEQHTLFWSLNRGAYFKDLPDSSLFVWDSHYCPVEGMMPLDTLLHDSHFQVLKQFVYDQPDHQSKTVVLLRTKIPHQPLAQIPEPVQVFDGGIPEEWVASDSLIMDFDRNIPEKILISPLGCNGSNALEIKAGIAYGPVVTRSLGDDFPLPLASIDIDMMLKPQKPLHDLHLVVECRQWKLTKYRFSQPIELTSDTSNWQSIHLKQNIALHEARRGQTVRVYLWNQGNNHVLIDNWKTTFYTNPRIKLWALSFF